MGQQEPGVVGEVDARVWSIEFALPGHLLSMNDRLHWRRKNNLVQAWRGATRIAAVEEFGGAPSHRARPACVVHVTLPVRDHRARDPHNYFATVKPIVDGLVDAGVWPNDTPQWVTTVEPTLEVRRPFPVVTVTLVERED